MFKDAIKLIERFEGCRLEPYQCSACRWTIGYGSTYLPNGMPVRATTSPITHEQAEALLAGTVIHIGEELQRVFTNVNVLPCQMTAMISLTYNIGVWNFINSTLCFDVKNHKTRHAANEFLKWDKMEINGNLVTCPGLLNRRQEERAVFLGKQHIS